MDLREVKRQIKELIDLMEGTEVSELEVERGGVRIKISKDHARADQGHAVPQVQIPLAQGTLPKSPTPEGGAKAEQEDFILVRSPIVGTFYRAPSPEAEPYVEVGETVKKGQILCVVEAMKLMNEIESEADGKLLEILVENARPVEYGEPLFKIEFLKQTESSTLSQGS
ncbi:MAG: acetyl-CoA carboxylase biotin carboxyl carrier protein [Nitrospiria bacterium]